MTEVFLRVGARKETNYPEMCIMPSSLLFFFTTTKSNYIVLISIFARFLDMGRGEGMKRLPRGDRGKYICSREQRRQILGSERGVVRLWES